MVQIDYNETQGTTLLTKAVHQCNVSKVNHLLLDEKVDIDEVDGNGYTPLQCAIFQWHKQLCIILLNCNAKIHGMLLLVAHLGNLKIMKLLLERGANVDERDRNGHTALHSAVSTGDLRVIKCLIDFKADINATDCQGQTSLHYAAKVGHVEVTKLLLENGAKSSIKDHLGRTSLDLAVEKDWRGTTRELLLDVVENKNFSDTQQIIYTVVQKNNLKAIKTMLTLGFDSGAILRQAVCDNKEQIINYLLNQTHDIKSVFYDAELRAADQFIRENVKLYLISRCLENYWQHPIFRQAVARL